MGVAKEQKVPEGYKMTEAGVIPEGWGVDSLLSRVHSFIDYRGVTPKKLGMEWGGGNILALSANNIQDGFIDKDKEAYFGGQKLYERWMRAGDCEKDDIVMTMEAPLGNVAFIPDNRKYILSQRALLIKVSSELDKVFFRYFLQSCYFQNQLLAGATGSTAKGIQRKKLEKILVYHPLSIEEQKAIATLLSDIDELIASLGKLIEKKKNIKKGAMQDLLTGKRRLPGFSGEWNKVQLGNLSTIESGLNKSAQYIGGDYGVQYITVLELYTGTRIDVRSANRIIASDAEIERYRLIEGDIVFGKSSVKRSGIGYPNIYRDCGVTAVYSGFTFRARIDTKKAEHDFVFYSLRAGSTRQWLISQSQASALTNINNSIANSIPVLIPPIIKEQKAIASLLSDVDSEIQTLEQKHRKLKLLKKGAMQQLLTGKIRLI